ncbi:MAG TPA: copper chaperone PCu(A)C [Woeseiaceae bacterium]|nr:copper chaperone PCu(A)C [Woeseiaceae bacterium]
MTRLVGLFALLVAVAGSLSYPAGGADAEGGGIRIKQAWARASIGTSRPAAAYVIIENGTDRPVTLTGVSSLLAGHAAVHKTLKQGSVMKMLPAEAIEIPPGGRLEMKPGGSHIMLMHLTRAIDEGTTLPLTLNFSDGTTLEAAALVLGPGAMGPKER